MNLLEIKMIIYDCFDKMYLCGLKLLWANKFEYLTVHIIMSVVQIIPYYF